MVDGWVVVFKEFVLFNSLFYCVHFFNFSGVDVVGLLAQIGIGEKILESKMTEGATTFVIAYAVHKIFAPVRIGITLTATPLIVRKLRAMGILKKPIQKQQ